jgi:hypothetical protein
VEGFCFINQESGGSNRSYGEVIKNSQIKISFFTRSGKYLLVKTDKPLKFFGLDVNGKYRLVKPAQGVETKPSPTTAQPASP